jgi:hypothetical protein
MSSVHHAMDQTMSDFPIPATSAFSNQAANGRTTVSNDAQRIVDKMNSGDRTEAMRLWASLMGVDDPEKIPPSNPNDPTDYGSQLAGAVLARTHIQTWAMSTLPNLLKDIKVAGPGS